MSKSYEFAQKILVDEFGVDSTSIRPDASLADLGLDSLSAAELIMEFEREFGIEVSEEDAVFETLGDAIELVDRLMGASDG